MLDAQLGRGRGRGRGGAEPAAQRRRRCAGQPATLRPRQLGGSIAAREEHAWQLSRRSCSAPQACCAAPLLPEPTHPPDHPGTRHQRRPSAGGRRGAGAGRWAGWRAAGGPATRPGPRCPSPRCSAGLVGADTRRKWAKGERCSSSGRHIPELAPTLRLVARGPGRGRMTAGRTATRRSFTLQCASCVGPLFPACACLSPAPALPAPRT